MSLKTLVYRWQWQLKSSPAALWDDVADTQRLNQALRLPAINFTENPLESGGSEITAAFRKFGLEFEYTEHPFNWVREQTYSVLREYRRGPFKQFLMELTLEPNPAGTLLRYHIDLVPANALWQILLRLQFKRATRPQFGRLFHQIDAAIQTQHGQPLPLYRTPLHHTGRLRLEELTQQLAQQGYDPAWVRQLRDLLADEADLNVLHLRPYRCADRWQAPRRPVLEMFLTAVKIGLVTMQWDLLCPLCRGVKVTATALDQVPKGVHCPTCNIDFEADFTQSMELTFAPHPQIRKIVGGLYCIGGPMTTPHILVQQTLAPAETRQVTVRLEAGSYRLRTQRPASGVWVDLLPGADQAASRTDAPQLFVQLHADRIDVEQRGELAAQTARPITLTLTNRMASAQRLALERGAWYTDAATAAQVTSLQHFRDLFSDEVLRPGEEIGIQSMTILFSDLVGSTAMYNRVGDAPSYALVREQFAFLQQIVRQCDGAIVKTIGDAIMAAFMDPAMGLQTALTIQRDLPAFNAAHAGTPLTIKLGLHQGPCIAVNLNGRLDYFGTTVNLAARLEGQSQGQDVVISAAIWRDRGVQRVRQTFPVNAQQFETAIKGFDQHIVLYRLTLAPGFAAMVSGIFL